MTLSRSPRGQHRQSDFSNNERTGSISRRFAPQTVNRVIYWWPLLWLALTWILFTIYLFHLSLLRFKAFKAVCLSVYMSSCQEITAGENRSIFTSVTCLSLRRPNRVPFVPLPISNLSWMSFVTLSTCSIISSVLLIMRVKNLHSMTLSQIIACCLRADTPSAHRRSFRAEEHNEGTGRSSART